MIVRRVLYWIAGWKEAFMTYFEVTSRHLPARTDEKYEKSQ
jgi:hypothetical protein